MGRSESKARQRFRRRVRAAMERADQAFRGSYATEIDALLGLSKEEINAITPGLTDLETYNKLIGVVKEASRVNLEQAELVQRIRSMGQLAVKIASKVPALAAMLA